MLKRFFTDLRKYFSFSVVSAKSQLKTEVAGSYLNWIWWILDPLCFMLIYTFIFGYVFSASEQYFPVFIFVGLSMWNFFNGTLKSSVRIVKRNKPIVSRVYFPKYILVVAQLMADAFKMMISFGIVVLMMIFFQVPISFNVLFFIPIIIILMLFTFGCSCIVMHFGVYVEDLANVINIVLRFLFYLTGIFYNIKTKIPNIGEYLNNYNPLASLITAMRDCLIYSRMPDLKFLGIWFVVSVLLTVGGVALVYKEENSYLKAV
ncbi:MAG: ABC transporter permease [Oscillospiraceae bacterium]|nr:ABC transporter permease [Oscillospiraceae bacterium]